MLLRRLVFPSVVALAIYFHICNHNVKLLLLPNTCIYRANWLISHPGDPVEGNCEPIAKWTRYCIVNLVLLYYGKQFDCKVSSLKSMGAVLSRNKRKNMSRWPIFCPKMRKFPWTLYGASMHTSRWNMTAYELERRNLFSVYSEISLWQLIPNSKNVQYAGWLNRSLSLFPFLYLHYHLKADPFWRSSRLSCKGNQNVNKSSSTNYKTPVYRFKF